MYWPVAVEKFSAGKAKNARNAIECPSITSKRGLDSDEDEDLDEEDLALALTHESLMPMTDKSSKPETGGTNKTTQATHENHPFATELTEANIPHVAWEYLRHHGPGELVTKLGIVFDTFTVEELTATMPVETNTQVAGILHGGASAALAETLGSFAAALHIVDSGLQGKSPVGVDLNITHHRGGVSGRVRGVCTPAHLGRTTTSHDIKIYDENNKLVATARITNQLIDLR